MVTGDAHLAAGLAARSEGAIFRDAHMVDEVGSIGTVLFIARRALVAPEMAVVDWQLAEGADEEKALAALGSLEAQVPGSFADAIREFVRSRDVTCVPLEEPEVRRGAGLVGTTSAGKTLAGSRALLLGEHVSTALLEDQAKTIEASGRRAVFLAIDEQLVAVFGVEERPLPGLQALNTRLRRWGLRPVMLTSAELGPAQTLAGRMGIEQVRFEVDEDDVGMVLGQLRESGERTLLVGHGAAFEESIRAANAALAVGGRQPTQAGVDAREASVAIVGTALHTARHAKRSVRVNLVLAGIAMSVGIGLAVSWFTHFVPVFAGTLSFGAAVLCTLNGPYPLLGSLAARTRGLTRRIRKLFVRT
jgi:Cu+-exporting ATPase